MRKILIALIVFLIVVSSNVFATTTNVYYDVSLTYNDDVLELNDYTHNSSDFLYNDGINNWAIYAEGDLTINLTGTNVIDDGIGIYVGGNLFITGDGTLDVCELVIEGEVFESSALVNVLGGSDYYFGPKVNYPMSVFNEEAGNKSFAFYDPVDGTYVDEFGDLYSSITFYPDTEVADLVNISDVTPLFRYNNVTLAYDIEIENRDGFVIYEPNVGTTVEYDPTGELHMKDAPVYDVTFYDDLSSNTPKLKYIELAFERSEWGKAIGYEVLSANNAFEYQLVDGVATFIPFVEGNTYYEIDGLVAERSLYKMLSSEYVGSAFYAFAITKDNSLSIKVLGKTHPVYININVVDTHNYSEPEQRHDFVIPNTGIIK